MQNEPLLKYELQSIRSISCFALSSRFLAIATPDDNTVSILDYAGNEASPSEALADALSLPCNALPHQVRKLPLLHSTSISSLCFSHEEEHLAASSEDGSVAIVDLFTSDPPTVAQSTTTRFLHRRPITSLSLEPRFSSRKTREYVVSLSPLPLVGSPGTDQGGQVISRVDPFSLASRTLAPPFTGDLVWVWLAGAIRDPLAPRTPLPLLPCHPIQLPHESSACREMGEVNHRLGIRHEHFRLRHPFAPQD